jgi:hypothetical protein
MRRWPIGCSSFSVLRENTSRPRCPHTFDRERRHRPRGVLVIWTAPVTQETLYTVASYRWPLVSPDLPRLSSCFYYILKSKTATSDTTYRAERAIIAAKLKPLNKAIKIVAPKNSPGSEGSLSTEERSESQCQVTLRFSGWGMCSFVRVRCKP